MGGYGSGDSSENLNLGSESANGDKSGLRSISELSLTVVDGQSRLVAEGKGQR